MIPWPQAAAGTRWLFRLPNWVGDAVMTMPALRSLYSEDQTWHGVCHPRVMELYAATGFFEQLSALEGPPWHLWRALRRWNPDRALVFTSPLTGRVLARLSGAPLRLGRGRFGLTDRLPADSRGQRLWVRHAELARAAGSGRQEHPSFLLDPGAAARKQARGWLRVLPTRPRLVIAPGAVYGPAKAWSQESFRVVIKWAHENGWVTVLLGGQQEAPLARILRPTLDLSGKTTLLEAIAVMAECRLALTHDSGAMHLARASGIQTVALFGSTSPRWTGLEAEEGIVLYEALSCSPCFLRVCRYRGERAMQCMRAITPQMVIQQIRRMESLR